MRNPGQSGVQDDGQQVELDCYGEPLASAEAAEGLLQEEKKLGAGRRPPIREDLATSGGALEAKEHPRGRP